MLPLPTLLTYELNSMTTLINRARQLPPTTAPDHARLLTLLAHITAARRVWLARIESRPPPPVWPESPTLDQIQADLDTAHAEWSAYAARLDNSERARVLTYENSQGDRFQNSVDEILQHLYGHSMYHRGQCATLLAKLGAPPPPTDFIFFARERRANPQNNPS